MSNSENKYGSRVKVRCLSGPDSTLLSSDSVVMNGTSIGGERERVGTSIDQGNGRLRSKVEEKKKVEDDVLETFKPLWDDGYGTQTVRDYFDMAKDIVKHDGGPPRWFCPVTCGRPLKDSPVLLFLPGNGCLTMADKLKDGFVNLLCVLCLRDMCRWLDFSF